MKSNGPVRVDEEGNESVCFVLMAISSQMKRIFKDVFEPVAREFGLKAEHFDIPTSSTVVPRVLSKIHSAKVVQVIYLP